MEALAGTWEQQPELTKGADDFLDALEVPKEGRMAYKRLVYLTTFTPTGPETWRARAEVKGLGQPLEVDCRMGEEVEYESLDGLKVKCTTTREGEAYCEKNESETGQEWRTVRTVEGDIMTLRSTCKGATMEQIFKKIA